MRSATPAAGGLSNTNVRVRIAEPDAELRLRVFHRGAAVAALEHAVAARLAGTVPLPHCHLHGDDGPDGRPFALYAWVDGERLETTALDPDGSRQIGRDCGRVLAAIHSVRFARTGLLDAQLSVCEPFAAGSAGLVAFAARVLGAPALRARLGEPLATEFEAWLPGAAGPLDAVRGASLCHGDFGASNLIVRREPEGWRIAAVLDWEYACAGTPFGDLGNLLRPPLGGAPGFADAVAHGYRDAGGSLPDDWRHLAQLSDLFAWIEFAGREHAGAGVLASVRERIRATMREP